MKILFDQGTPVPLRRHLHPHRIDTVGELGWATLTNGKLLAAAGEAGHEVLVTTDQNLQYQQNLKTRKIAVVVLKTTSWPRIRSGILRVVEAIEKASAGSYIEVHFE